MQSKLLFIILTLAFSRCSASQSVEGLQEDSIKQALNNRFIEAAKQGATALMLDLLRNGITVTLSDGTIVNAKPDVNARDEHGWTALKLAARFDHFDCVKVLIEPYVQSLIETKADVNIRDEHGQTALQLAAMAGQSSCVKALIKAQANVNVCNNYKTTALHFAAGFGHLDCVKALIEARADINTPGDRGWTALALAAHRGHVDCVKALIEAKADINAHDKTGNTALHAASEKGHIDCFKTLIKYSYTLVASEEAVSQARKRIFNALLQFVRLRNKNPELENLKADSLQYEILSWNKLLQEDLAIILLDELKKGREIKSTALIRSKEAVISYLLRKVEKIVSSISFNTLQPAVARFFDPANLKKTLSTLIKEGLDERIERLKTQKTL